MIDMLMVLEGRCEAGNWLQACEDERTGCGRCLGEKEKSYKCSWEDIIFEEMVCLSTSREIRRRTV